MLGEARKTAWFGAFGKHWHSPTVLSVLVTLHAGPEVQTIVTPKEIIWLNGPPGAGKGANVEFIKRIRGLSHSCVMSKVLARHPDTASIMEQGGLVSDAKVCECLLDAIFDPAHASPSGCIVDGFPRSEIQVPSSAL